MLMWYSRGIYNLLRERVQGVSFEETGQGYNIILDSTSYEEGSKSKIFKYSLSEKDTAEADYQIFKDCFLNVCVSGNNTRMFNPPVEATESLARGERRSNREATTSSSLDRMADALRAARDSQPLEEYEPSGGNFRISMPSNYSISAYIDELTRPVVPEDAQAVVPEGMLLSNPTSQEDEA